MGGGERWKGRKSDMVENDDIFFLHFSIFAFFVLAIRFITISTRDKKEKKEVCVGVFVFVKTPQRKYDIIYFVSEREREER